MSAALLGAATVVVLGAALRPRPGRSPAEHAAPPLIRPHRLALPAAIRGAFGRHGTACQPEDVAAWCDELARLVRSGSTLAGAVRTAAPPSNEVAAVHLALDRGVPLAIALSQAPAGSGDLQVAFTVLRACAEQGGPPGEPIDRAAAILRARAADLAERRTHSAQARLSAVVMTWLPVAMLAVLVVTSASVRGALATPAGIGVLAAGALLNVVGWRWMGRIIEDRR